MLINLIMLILHQQVNIDKHTLYVFGIYRQYVFIYWDKNIDNI